MDKKNKLYDYGLETAKVGGILIEPELKTPTPQCALTGVAPKYPDCFPNSVKHAILPEQDSYYFALSCVQSALKMIPKAEPIFDNILKQLQSPGCQKLEKKNLFDKFLSLYVQKRHCLRLRILPRILFMLPNFLTNRDFRELFKLIQIFIIQVYNRDPENPRICGSHILRVAILHYAKFCNSGIGPYEYDQQYRRLSAEVARTRPKTKKGRAIKPQYDHAMKGYKKRTDKYYRNGARKFLMARVICNTVAEAANKLKMDYDTLRGELYDEPWDDIMGYLKS